MRVSGPSFQKYVREVPWRSGLVPGTGVGSGLVPAGVRTCSFLLAATLIVMRCGVPHFPTKFAITSWQGLNDYRNI